jgi:HK97 family phage prohead protease
VTRDTVIRARSDLAFRAADEQEDDLGAGYLGLLKIRFSPVNEWAEINSAWEGHFMERFAPGAWKKTIREGGNRIKALFQHGADPQVGDKPLGPFHRLEEDEGGGYAEVKLLDTSYNRDLLPGLKEGLYGASHRFGVIKASEEDFPEPSESNPRGIKEVTIKEARLSELGPVTFPAYEGASAGVRSMTDEFLLSCIRSEPEKLRSMLDAATNLDNLPVRSDEQDALSDEEEAVREDTSPTESRHTGHSALIPSTKRRRSVLDV